MKKVFGIFSGISLGIYAVILGNISCLCTGNPIRESGFDV